MFACRKRCGAAGRKVEALWVVGKRGIDAVFPIGAEIQVPGKTMNYDVFRLY